MQSVVRRGSVVQFFSAGSFQTAHVRVVNDNAYIQATELLGGFGNNTGQANSVVVSWDAAEISVYAVSGTVDIKVVHDSACAACNNPWCRIGDGACLPQV